ncbi:MAG: hypothetical protein GIW95_00265, partial [Candidatus Eremiobacteraeota bacterium]|nr:hypothetical protein [Candidatus Eremiobacteraeota bacterium]
MPDMLKDLRALRDIRAPKGFTERVLAAVFGAERFAPLPSTVGTVYVAWNARGISAVMFADSDADFRSRFERRFGRRLERAAGVPPTLKHAVLEGDAASKRRLTYD